MRKRKEKVFTVKASKMKADGQEIQDIEQLKEAKNITVTFETAKDYLIFALSGLIDKIKELPESNSLKEKVGSLEEMREFFDTRVTAFWITPSPGSPIPYKYDVAYKAIGEETKEEVEQKIKEYLHSQVFNFILGQADPRVLEIIRQKEELRQKEEDLARREAELKKKEGKVGRKKIRVGKNLIDNALKTRGDAQLKIFEDLGEVLRSKIIDEGTDIDLINQKGEGIHFSKGELKLLLCLAQILQDKSNSTDSKKEDYYLGEKIEGLSNMVNITTKEGGKLPMRAPSISFTLYEITKEFSSVDNPGGKDIKAVANILHGLAYSSDKRALIRYRRKEIIDKDRERITRIETYSPLIDIFNFEQEEIFNGKKIDQAKEIIVRLHPVFIDQIDKIFIELPEPKDIMQVYGTSNVSEVVFKLLFELSRALSNRKKLPKDEEGNPIYTIGVKKLQDRIAEKYTGRKADIERFSQKAIETAVGLEMVKSYTQESGATGEKLYKFTLSKDW